MSKLINFFLMKGTVLSGNDDVLLESHTIEQDRHILILIKIGWGPLASQRLKNNNNKEMMKQRKHILGNANTLNFPRLSAIS